MAGKSFMVVDGELRLKITPDSGWYCVEGLDNRGLVAQGRTVEEAIFMAHAAKALAESRAIMAAQKAAKTNKRNTNPSKSNRGQATKKK